MIKSNPILTGWTAHRLESNYITEAYPWENSEPHVRFPHLGVWHWEEEPPEHLVLKASGAGLVHRSSMGLGEMGTPLLKGPHRLLCVLGSQGKAETPQQCGSDLPADLR